MSRSRWLTLAVVLLCGWIPRLTLAQTPSPLQEWQYSAGVPLIKLLSPTVPEWRFVMGVAAQVRPLYDGSKPYRVVGGPVITIYYRDVAFASVGEGLGVNLIHSEHVRLGVAMAYDLGRRTADYYTRLAGLESISPAPVAKVFGSYVVSKQFPLVLRADIRRSIGGTGGLLGDLEAYMPMPGSSEKFVWFAGPSITFADRRYFQNTFGITPAQSLASGYPAFDTHAGTDAVGFGITATRIINKRWLLNLDGAVNRLRGSAAESPITQKTSQRALAASVAYMW